MKYHQVKVLTKNIILIDGVARSGKLLTGALVSSFKNSEHLEFGLNFEYFCPAIEFNKLDLDYANAFITTHLNNLIYNKYLSRNVNFRPSDRTGVPNSINMSTYKRRLYSKEGNKIIDLILKEKKQIPFITHNILVTINALNKLDFNYKMIEIFRNPLSLVMSWYKRGLGERFGKDKRMFTLLIKKKNKIFPWYDQISNSNSKVYNELEKCANYVYFLTKKSTENFENLKNKDKKKIFITSYENIVENTYNELKKISVFLNLKFSDKTTKFLKKNKVPSKIDEDILNYNRSFLESKLNKKTFKKLIDLEEKLNNNIYNLKNN